jgi:hypothetical protein
LSQYIAKVNYYRDMWFRRHEILVRIHRLAPHQARSSLNGNHLINRHLIKLRNSLERREFSVFPMFNKAFHLYTDASDHQLGAVIMQDRKPIAIYLRKLITAQKQYTTTEKEK